MLNFIDIAQCSMLVNGILQCPNGATIGVFGDTCTFSCNADYELKGPISGTCLANQSWSEGNPTCVASSFLIICIYSYI